MVRKERPTAHHGLKDDDVPSSANGAASVPQHPADRKRPGVETRFPNIGFKEPYYDQPTVCELSAMLFE